LRSGVREPEGVGEDASLKAAGKRGRHEVPPPYQRLPIRKRGRARRIGVAPAPPQGVPGVRKR